MGKKVVEKKRKKKGRPSLLDLQKRNLRLQEQHQQQQQPNQKPKRGPNPNPNPNPYLRFPPSNSSRRSGRRNTSAEEVNNDEDDDDEDEDVGSNSNGRKRREKELRFVLRLPPPPPSIGEGLDSDGDAAAVRKRKIDDVGGSEPEDRDLNDGAAWEQTERRTFNPKATDSTPNPETVTDVGPTTPLPDKKLLVFILDRLQKKDTYAVFSEPVDPDELPDYLDVIEHPMDFSTIRKKLSSGAYANLEQFENDVLLICSNAMRYNAPGTIYFRQARSMQELAKKDFESLRQDSEDNAHEIKPARRGRPPGKSSIKRMMTKLHAERAASEFSPEATLATAGDCAGLSNSISKKGALSDKQGIAEVSGRDSHGSRNGDASGWHANHKPEKNDDFPGSLLKGLPKFGKSKLVIDEDRRNTYKQSHHVFSGSNQSILGGLVGERKPLIAVGAQMEHAYTRSLARFAANLGHVAWKVASKRIQRALPAGMKFGPGWVGENDAPPRRTPVSISPGQLPWPSPLPLLPVSETISQSNLASTSTQPQMIEPLGNKLPDSQEPSGNSTLDNHSSKTIPPYTGITTSPNQSSVQVENTQTTRGMNHGSDQQGSSGIMKPSPHLLHQQNLPSQSTINGFSGGFGFHLPSQVGKMGRTSGKICSDISAPSRTMDVASRSNSSFNYPMTMMLQNNSQLRALHSSISINSGNSLMNSSQEDQISLGSRQGLLVQPKPESVPPDLNIGFQSPNSPPTSGVMVDSQQPDLALQL